MDDITLVRGLYEAFARGDVAARVAACDEGLMWEEAGGFPHIGGRHVGTEAVLSVFASLPRDWESMTFEPHDFLADGEIVVVLGETGATCRATGKSYTSPFAHRWRLRGGKVTGWRAYLDTALAQATTSVDA